MRQIEEEEEEEEDFAASCTITFSPAALLLF
jgi:hypothetical protein